MRSLRMVVGFGIGMLFAFSVASAFADNNGRSDDEQTQGQLQGQAQGQGQHQSAGAFSGAVAGAAAGSLAVGGDNSAAGGSATGGSSDNAGNAYSSSTRNSNFYVSRSLPASANNCVISADGGGGGDTGAGFLGIQWIDDNCWKNQLAEQERNADLKARLKCGGSKYRKSVAWEYGMGKKRHAYCVNYTKEIYLAEIAGERALVEQAKAEAAEIRKHEAEMGRLNESNRRKEAVANSGK